jgi:hypothetical protein
VPDTRPASRRRICRSDGRRRTHCRTWTRANCGTPAP